MESKNSYKNKSILITGGLGFVGSNLAIRLVREGAQVTLVDNMLPRHGGNLFNIEEVRNEVVINFSDIRDAMSMNYLVQGKDYIFHLAGQVNHIDSIRDPINDVEINCKGTLVLLEACRQFNKNAKIIFTGTRGQYGPAIKLPVDEDCPMNPKGIYAISNMAAEKMILVYNDVHNIRGACLRITNTYGPRHQMMHDEYGVLNWFIRKAIDNEEIHIFGDGKIVRDFLYVDDLVDCLFAIALCERAYGDVFNVGSGRGIDFFDLVKKIITIAGSGSYKFTDFTKERLSLEPGDYTADITKIKKVVDWTPMVNLPKGLMLTIDYYKKFKKYYW